MDPTPALAIRAAVALLFVAAAAHKLGDLARFRGILAAYRLVPSALVPLGALVIVGVEVGTVAALVAERTVGLVGAAVVLLVYAAAIALNLARGRRHIDCGCLGVSGREALSWVLVARNVLLALGALVGAGPVAARPLLWVDAVTVAGVLAVGSALWVAADRLAAHRSRLTLVRGAA